MNKVIVGQRHMVERLLIGLLRSRTYPLLEGVPGLSQRLWPLIHLSLRRWRVALAESSLHQTYLPADVVGTLIYNMKALTTFTIKKGAYFRKLCVGG